MLEGEYPQHNHYFHFRFDDRRAFDLAGAGAWAEVVLQMLAVQLSPGGEMKLSFWIGFFVAALVGWIVADCSAGKTRILECEVAEHHYVAAWTDTETHVDSEGRVSVVSVYHPEEYRLVCEVLGEERPLDFETDFYHYRRLTNGQYVSVRVREGRWTKGRYFPTVEQ